MEYFIKLRINQNCYKVNENYSCELLIKYDLSSIKVDDLGIDYISLVERNKKRGIDFHLLNGKTIELKLNEKKFVFFDEINCYEYKVDLEYTFKKDDVLFRLENINLDLLTESDLKELSEVYSFYKKTIDSYIKILKLLDGADLDYEELSNADSLLFRTNSVEELLHSIGHLKSILKSNLKTDDLHSNYLNLIEHYKIIRNDSKCVLSTSFAKYLNDLDKEVFTYINELFVENERRVKDKSKNSFSNLCGEFKIVLQNRFNKDYIKGLPKIIDFNKELDPIIEINNQVNESEYYLRIDTYNQLLANYNYQKENLKRFWNSKLSDKENIEILKKMSFDNEPLPLNTIELEDSFTREQRDAYSYQNNAIENGLVKPEKTDFEKVKDLCIAYDYLYN